MAQMFFMYFWLLDVGYAQMYLDAGITYATFFRFHDGLFGLKFVNTKI